MMLLRANEAQPKCEPYFYAGERGFQTLLVLLTVICVPWMLLAKPLVILR
jgi:V-type H+-transporting ATPase subunit a